MLEIVELPAGVAELDPGLADEDAETLPHVGAVAVKNKISIHH